MTMSEADLQAATLGGKWRSNHTPPRSVRVPDDLWEAAKARAEKRGETVTDVIVRALKRYTR